MAFLQWAKDGEEFACRVVCNDCWHEPTRKISFPRSLSGADRDRLWQAAHQRLQEVNQSEAEYCPGCQRLMCKGEVVLDSSNIEVQCDRYVQQ